jgi:hypothetical protein
MLKKDLRVPCTIDQRRINRFIRNGILRTTLINRTETGVGLSLRQFSGSFAARMLRM